MILNNARRQRWRFAIGMIEIAGVGFSLGIIWIQGLTLLALVALAATTALSLVSLYVFRHD
jgi:hypothetical protein